MNKTAKKKLQMPSGIRNKLLAAVSMLLVSTILMVSTTYAWFTLSTAPEITGISTSVGANGNLEMALLNNETYADMDLITSAVGDSASVKAVNEANVTWGNLVDLSDAASYHLDKIQLMPSRLNVAAGAEAVANAAQLLKTAVYGADGRVRDVSGTTYASGAYVDGGWAYDSTALTYGVRAIGANDNLTAQQAGLMSAKTGYAANMAAAKSTVQAALSTNGHDLASAITTLAMNTSDAALTEDQKTAIGNMVTATGIALGNIDTAYTNVLLAAATTIADNTAYSLAVATIGSATDFSDALVDLGSQVTVPSQLTDAKTALDTQKTAVADAKTAIASGTDADYKTALGKMVNTQVVTINGYENKSDDVSAATPTNAPDLMIGGNINSTFMNKVIDAGGAVVEMPDNSGVFSYIANVAGNYSAATLVDVSFKGLTLNNMNATMKTTATLDTAIPTVLAGVTAVSNGGGATALSDTYGYALDMAFRTNAASSSLQLQTAAAQRVYTDSTSTLTQGAGSTMTFKSLTTAGGSAVLGDTQVKALMEAIRVAFINPESGDIYAIAALDKIAPGAEAGSLKGELYLKDYTVDANGVMTLSARAVGDTSDDLMELTQNTPAKLSVVVWMDGDMVDNGDTANAAQSITGSMNLQFSSSAELNPMQNTALKNLEA